MVWRRGFRKNATHRSSVAGLPPSGLPERELKLAWYGDRLRRATQAMEDALSEAKRALRSTMPSSSRTQTDALKKVITTLEAAIEAEQTDAAR